MYPSPKGKAGAGVKDYAPRDHAFGSQKVTNTYE